MEFDTTDAAQTQVRRLLGEVIGVISSKQQYKRFATNDSFVILVPALR